MLHLPEKLPDETLYSLLARIAIVNGMEDHLNVFSKLFGQLRPTSIISVSNGMNKFCDLTHGAYGSLDMIRSDLTVFPLLQHLNVDSNTTLRSRVWLDARKFDHSGNTRHEWRVCSQCRNEEKLAIGFSYWHRSHQLPTTYYCASHGVPLRSYNIIGKQLHDRFWLPLELYSNSDTPDSTTIMPKAAIALAIIGRDALNDRDEPFSADVIRNTFYGSIRDRNLLTRTGKIRWKECLNDFYNLGLGNCNATIPSNLIRQLLEGLDMSKTTLALQNYILLVYWLFGTWQYFKECCKWVATMGDCRFDSNVNAMASAGEYSYLQESYRKICLDFIQTNPTATRADFLNQQYKSFRWLLRNDAVWLDAILPTPSRVNFQIDLFS